MKWGVVKLEHYDVDYVPIEDLLEPFVDSKVWYNSGGTIYIDYMRDAMKYRYYIIRKEEINRGLYVKFLQSYKKIIY